MPRSTRRGVRAARFGRFDRWRRSWRLALRLAMRDAHSHRGRSILIMILVLAPVLLIGSASTWWSTAEISAAEGLPTTLGNSQAKIIPVDGPIEQLPAGLEYDTASDPNAVIPGREPGTPWTAAELSRLTGGTVLPVDYPSLVQVTSSGPARLQALALDRAALPNSGLARLTSGRWPERDDEVAVTGFGLARGLPNSGSLTLKARESPSTHPVTVVGVVTALDPDRRPVDLVTDDVTVTWTPEGSAAAFLLQRESPVSWGEVRAWNAYGLLVQSREVILNPPPASDQPAQLRQRAGDNEATEVGLMALIAVGLLLETSLLAGPAFAVSAARQRRSLALIASNGAERGQLRRYVLSQALLLGAVAAVLGSLLGLAGGAGLVRLHLYIDPAAGVGPFDPPWVALLVLVLAAVTSSLVAASVPARGAARVEIADVLAGRERSRPLRARTPLLGGSLILVGAAVLVARIQFWPGSYFGALDVVATMVLILAGLLLIGGVLTGLGGMVRRLPLPVRLPVRDAARQRSRSASAIAAVTVTVATLTILVVANASDDQQGRRDYQTDRIAGRGYLYAEDEGVESALAAIRSRHPDWRIYRVDQLGPLVRRDGRGRVHALKARPPGCSAADAFAVDDTAISERCAQVGGDGERNLAAVSGALVSETRLPQVAAEVWARGGMLVDDPEVLVDGQVRLVLGSFALPDGDQIRIERELSVPGAVVSSAELRQLAREAVYGPVSPTGWSPYTGGVMSVEAAERLGLPTHPQRYEIVDPTGPISRADERAINGTPTLGTGGSAGEMTVERGYVSDVRGLIWVLFGISGTLILVAALVATALAQAEGQADSATLAALGGTLALRRRLVAGQALVIGAVGSVLGVALGLLPGCAVALSLTSFDATGAQAHGIVAIPWLPLGLTLAGVPLVGALVAAAAVRRTPPLTRRLT